MSSSCRKSHPAPNGWTSAYFKPVKIRDIPNHRHFGSARKKRCRACFNRNPPDVSCESKSSLPDPVLHECTSKSNERQLVTVHGSNLSLLERILNRRLRKNTVKDKYSPSCSSASSQPFVATDENLCCKCCARLKRLVPVTTSDCRSCPSLPDCRSTHEAHSHNPEDCNKTDDSPYNKPIQLFMFLNTPYPQIHITPSGTNIETCINTCAATEKLPSTDKDHSPQSQVQDEVILDDIQVAHSCPVNMQHNLFGQACKTTVCHREIYAQRTTPALCETAFSELPRDNELHDIDHKVINISSKGKLRFYEIPERVQSKTTNDEMKYTGVNVQVYQSRPTTENETLRNLYDKEDGLCLTSRHSPDSVISKQEEEEQNNPEPDCNIEQDVSERSKEFSTSSSSLSKGINEISSSLLTTSSLDELIGIIQDWWKKNKSHLKSQAADNPSSLPSSRTNNTSASYFSDEVLETNTSTSALEGRIKTKESDNVWSNSVGSSLNQGTGYSDISTSGGTVSVQKTKKLEFESYYPHSVTASNEYLYGEKMLYNDDEPYHRGKYYGHPGFKPTSLLDKYTQLNYYDDPTFRFRDYEGGGTYDILSNTVPHTNEFYRNYRKATHVRDEFPFSNDAPKLFGNCKGIDLRVNKDIPYNTTYSLYGTSNAQQNVAYDIRAGKETQMREPCRTFTRYSQPSELRPTNTFIKYQYDERREPSGNAPLHDNRSVRPSTQANEIPVLANGSLHISDENKRAQVVKLPISKTQTEKNAELNTTKGSFRNEGYSCIPSPVLNYSRESPAPKMDGAIQCDTVQCAHQFPAGKSYRQACAKTWTDISSYERTRNIAHSSDWDMANNIRSNQAVTFTDYCRSGCMLRDDSALDPASNSVSMPISIVSKENRLVSLSPIIQPSIKTTNIYQNNNCSLAILPVVQLVDQPPVKIGTNNTERHQTPNPPELSTVGEPRTSLDEELQTSQYTSDPVSSRFPSSDRNVTRLKEILKDTERILFEIADEYPPSARPNYTKVANTTVQRNDINRYSRIDILNIIVHANTFHPLQTRSFSNDSYDTKEQSYNSMTSSEARPRSPHVHQSDVRVNENIFNWIRGLRIERPRYTGQYTAIPTINDSWHSDNEILLREEDLSSDYSELSDIRPQNVKHSSTSCRSSENNTICENSSFCKCTLNTALPTAAQNLSLLPVSGRDVRTVPTSIADWSNICHQQMLPVSLPTFNASKADASVMCSRETSSSKDVSVKYIFIPVHDSAVSTLGTPHGRRRDDSLSTKYQDMTEQSWISDASGACCISLLSDKTLDIPSSSDISNSCYNKPQTVHQESTATPHSWQEKCQKICQIPLPNLLTMNFQDSSRFEFGSDKHSHLIAPISVFSNENVDRTTELSRTSPSIKSMNSPNFVPNLQTDTGVNTEFPMLTYDSQFNHILEKDKRKQRKKKQLKIKKAAKEKSSPFSMFCVPITSRNVGPSSQPCRERRDLVIIQEGSAKKPKSKSSRK